MFYPPEVGRLIAAYRSGDIDDVYLPAFVSISKKLGIEEGPIFIMDLVELIDLLLQTVVSLNNESRGTNQTVEDLIIQLLDG